MPPHIPLTLERKRRRPHTKSRNGCSTCKKRQVRCDEHRPECLNCHRLSLTCGYTCEQNVAVINWTQPLQVLTSLNQHPDWLDRDSYFFHHLSRLVFDLQESKRQQLVFGGLVLHEALKIAMQKDFVRHAICALSASHLSSLTKITSTAHAGSEYRYLAIRGLRQGLVNTNADNLVAILASSLVLSWQAPSSDEYTQTMQGVKTVLEYMDAHQYQSDLRSLLVSSEEPLSSQHTISDLPEQPLVKASKVLNTILKRFQTFQVDSEFKRSIKELSNYLSGLAMLSVTNTPTEFQLQAIFPIRNWMFWFPNAFRRLAQGDPVVMLFFACYEMVHLAIAPVLPATSTPLSIFKRAKIIENLNRQLTDIESSFVSSGSDSTEQSRALRILKTLMAGPLSWTHT